MSLFTNMMPTEFDVPANVARFQDDVQGIGAIVKAVKDMIDGKVDKALFKIGKHNGSEWIEMGSFMIEMGVINGKRCFREGNGSLIASWNPNALDPAYVVGTIVANYGHNVFRQKV